MASITLEHTKKIIKKLKAEQSQRSSKHHKFFDVLHNGKIVTSLGVSHSPKKDKPHDHIPNQLFLSRGDTKKMAECNISQEQYIKILEANGVV